MTEFPTFTADSDPEVITAGPDGNIWFTEAAVGKIGCMTPAGRFATLASMAKSRRHTADSPPIGITAGTGRQSVVRRRGASKIGCITTAGAFCNVGTSGEIATATAAQHPIGIAAGPDGNLWFTEQAGQQDRLHHHRRGILQHRYKRRSRGPHRRGRSRVASPQGRTVRCGSPK